MNSRIEAFVAEMAECVADVMKNAPRYKTEPTVICSDGITRTVSEASRSLGRPLFTLYVISHKCKISLQEAYDTTPPTTLFDGCVEYLRDLEQLILLEATIKLKENQ